MVQLGEIKVDLPCWPDDVVEQWLLRLANRGPDTGWPPPDPLDGSAWKYILGHRPLPWWQQVSWTLEEDDLEFDSLCGGTKRIVVDMLNTHVGGGPARYPVGPDGKERFSSALRYIAQHGSIPRPLIAMRINDGISVLDGNHRIAALCFCRQAREEIVKQGGVAPLENHPIWIGTHCSGELPLD
jgi:hypothetical protein